MNNRNKYCEKCKRNYDKYYFNKHKCIAVEKRKSDKVCQKCKKEFDFASACKRHQKSCHGPLLAWNDVYNIFLTATNERLIEYVNNQYLQGETDDSEFSYQRKKAFINRVIKCIVRNKKNCTFKWTDDLQNLKGAVKDKNNRWKRERIFFLDDVCSVYKKATKAAFDRLDEATEGAIWEVCDEFKNLHFGAIVTTITSCCQERLQRDLPR